MARGYSLFELLIGMTMLVIVTAMAVPIAFSSVEYSRASAAARYVASRLALARMEAVKRSAYVALRFELKDGRYRFGTYIDGNRNGVRSVDISRKIDLLRGQLEALDDQFSGATFGLLEGVTPVTPGENLEGGDPIRIGRSDLLSFAPVGSATSGTLYIRGRGKQQFAVRILGVTGRVSVLHFDFQNRRWTGR